MIASADPGGKAIVLRVVRKATVYEVHLFPLLVYVHLFVSVRDCVGGERCRGSIGGRMVVLIHGILGAKVGVVFIYVLGSVLRAVGGRHDRTTSSV